MKKNKTTIFILLFLVITIFYPLVTMLVNVEWNTFSELLKSNAFKSAFKNSVFITSIATIISISIAYLLAYTINRTKIKHKGILKVLLTLPMLIPSISHGIGLINLFGANGIISKIFNFNIVGGVGIVIGSILYSFPVAFLMLSDGFNYVDNTMYDSAKILGMNKWQTFKKVTFCYLKKPFFSSVFATFTLIFTDYGVPLAVGGKFTTLPVFLYKQVIGLLDFSRGTMIGLFLLIPAFISFLFDNLSKDYSIGDYSKKYKIETNKVRDVLLKIFLYLILIFVVVIISSFIYYAFVDNPALNKSLSFKHFDYVLKDKLWMVLTNSLIIAVITSIIGTIISYMVAYYTARIKGKLSKIAHILTIISLAIPGIVLGLSYTIGFRNTPIYNTYLILIMVNIVHFIASPYLMAYNALLKVNPNYELVAKTCKISSFKIIKDVIVPCTKKTIREMFAYFFVNSMVTISAVAFLFNTKTLPMSLLISKYEEDFLLGEAAIISLIILAINLFVKLIVYFLNRKEVERSVLHEVNL